MLIRVYVTPNAREAAVIMVSEDYFEVRVYERAMGGGSSEQETSGDSSRTLQVPINQESPYYERNRKTRNKIVRVIREQP